MIHTLTDSEWTRRAVVESVYQLVVLCICTIDDKHNGPYCSGAGNGNYVCIHKIQKITFVKGIMRQCIRKDACTILSSSLNWNIHSTATAILGKT